MGWRDDLSTGDWAESKETVAEYMRCKSNGKNRRRCRHDGYAIYDINLDLGRRWAGRTT